MIKAQTEALNCLTGSDSGDMIAEEGVLRMFDRHHPTGQRVVRGGHTEEKSFRLQIVSRRPSETHMGYVVDSDHRKSYSSSIRSGKAKEVSRTPQSWIMRAEGRHATAIQVEDRFVAVTEDGDTSMSEDDGVPGTRCCISLPLFTNVPFPDRSMPAPA